MKQADITFKDNQFHVNGDLDFSNVMSVYAKSLNQMESCPELIINFSELKSSDSSGLALIIEWIKYAKLQHKPISITHLPQRLLSIAKAARIENLIL